MRLIPKLNVILMLLTSTFLVAAVAMPQMLFPSYNIEQSLPKIVYYDVLKKAEKDRTINVIFKTQYGNYTWGLKSKNGIAADKIGGYPDANLIIKCNYTLSKSIMKSKDPIPQIIKELLKGNIIVYKPRNTFERNLLNQVLEMLKMALKVTGSK